MNPEFINNEELSLAQQYRDVLIEINELLENLPLITSHDVDLAEDCRKILDGMRENLPLITLQDIDLAEDFRKTLNGVIR